MTDTCAMYVHTSDGYLERKEFDAFHDMRYEARENPADRVLYWWCELEELRKVGGREDD